MTGTRALARTTAATVLCVAIALLPSTSAAAPSPAPDTQPGTKPAAATVETVKAAFTRTEKAAEAMNAANEEATAILSQMRAVSSSITDLQVVYNDRKNTIAQAIVDQQLSNPLGSSTALLASSNSDQFLDGLASQRVVADAQASSLDQLDDDRAHLRQQEALLADKRKLLQVAHDDATRSLQRAKASYRTAKAQLAQLDAAKQAAVDARAATIAEDVPDTPPVVLATGDAKVVLTFALEQLGDPYSWGGNGPDGWDCSGLVQGAMAASGVSVPRIVGAQYDASQHIDMSDLRPADLVFYDDMSHIGIYVGDGKVVHAPRPGRDVEMTTLSGFSLAGRYLNP